MSNNQNYQNYKSKLYNNFLIIFIIQILSLKNLLTFNNVKQLNDYIQSVPEFPDYNGNISKSDFSKFYQTLKKPLIKNVLNKIGLFNRLIGNNNYHEFYKNLKEINNKNKKNDPIKYLNIEKNSKIFLWGDIQAGLHSFARSLSYLYKTKIIDQNFKINNPKTYFIFNGNAIGIGPYPVETLNLILKLILINPNQIFYIRGHEENLHIWTKHNLKKQLSALQKKIKTYEINKFLQNLPQSLFLKLNNNIISVSYNNPEVKNEDIENITTFIKGNDLMTNLNILNKKTYLPDYLYGQGLYRLNNINNKIAWTTKSSAIQLYRMKYNLFYDSFTVLDLQSDNINNNTITIYFNNNNTDKFKKGSCYNLITGELIKIGKNPLKLNTITKNNVNNDIKFIIKKLNLAEKKLNNFESNLKKELINTKIENNIIDDVNYNVLKEKINNKNFLSNIEKNLNLAITKLEKLEKLAHANNLISNDNEELQTLENSNEIKIGSSASLTKLAKGIGKSIRQGLSLAITDINKAGGLNNQFIKLIFLNDKYTPYLFEKNIKTLFYYYKTNLLLLPEGTKNIKHTLNFIKNNNIFIFFSRSGASFLRDPKLKNVINYRPSFQDEGRVLTRHIIEEHGNTKFLFFYQDDEFGRELLQGAKNELNKHGIKNWTEIPYKPNISALKKAALKIKESDSDTIGFFSLGNSAIEIIRELGIEFFANKFLFGASSLSDIITLKILKRFGLKILSSEVVPSPLLIKKPGSLELEIVKEYKEKLNQYNYKPNAFSLEAYICTNILIDQISKIKGHVTGEKIIKNMENIKNYNFKGLKLNFNPETRTLSTSIWIKTRENKYIEKTI